MAPRSLTRSLLLAVLALCFLAYVDAASSPNNNVLDSRRVHPARKHAHPARPGHKHASPAKPTDKAPSRHAKGKKPAKKPDSVHKKAVHEVTTSTTVADKPTANANLARKVTSSKKKTTTTKPKTTAKPKTTSTPKTTSKPKTTAKPTTTSKPVKVVTPKTTSSTSSAAAASSTTIQTTLVDYTNYAYAYLASNQTSLYTLWRKKCIDTVGPQGFHHVINVTDATTATNKRAYVYCHGVPKNPATQGFYTKSDPYNSTCVLGPQRDWTSTVISHLKLTQVGTTGTLQQVPGC